VIETGRPDGHNTPLQPGQALDHKHGAREERAVPT